MLNADLIALYNFDVVGEYDEPTCAIDECPKASTARFVSVKDSNRSTLLVEDPLIH